jgi:hypothetical protein
VVRRRQEHFHLPALMPRLRLPPVLLRRRFLPAVAFVLGWHSNTNGGPAE